MAGGGRGRPARETEQTRHFQRQREEAQADLHSGPGEAISGGVFCGAAPAVVGENRGDSWEIGPQKERGASMVLQPKTKTEEVEIFRDSLMDYTSRRKQNETDFWGPRNIALAQMRVCSWLVPFYFHNSCFFSLFWWMWSMQITGNPDELLFCGSTLLRYTQLYYSPPPREEWRKIAIDGLPHSLPLS